MRFAAATAIVAALAVAGAALLSLGGTSSAGVQAPTELTCVGPDHTVEPYKPGVITATLVEDDGPPLAGRQIQWSNEPGLGLISPLSSATDDSGTASTNYGVPIDGGFEGIDTVTATFIGDASHGPSDCDAKVHADSPPIPLPTPPDAGGERRWRDSVVMSSRSSSVRSVAARMLPPWPLEFSRHCQSR